MCSPRKLLLPVLLLLCFMAMPGTSSAYGGGELVYRWMSDSTYRFFFKLYRDCAGPARPISVTLCGTNNCNAASNINQTMGLWGGAINGNMPNGTRLNASCAGVPTRCEDASSTIPNYEEWWYSVDVTLHTRCNWRFSVVTSRDVSVNLGSGSLYVEATFNNFDFQGNSSPFYSARPVTNICFNKLYGYNNGAVDVNADSLVSDIIMPMNAPNCGAIPTVMSFTTASPPYSLTFNPIQTGNTFTLDRNTGHMSFIPFQLGSSAMAVRTREYRGGRLVGSVMRDFNINVVNNCNTGAAAPAVAVKTVTGGIYNGGVVYTCQEFQVNLCFDVVSPNPGSVLKVSTNINDLFANAVSNYTGQGSDSIRTCIQHSATSADSGLHTLVVTVMDSSCLSPGLVNYYRYTIPIMVWGKTYALKYSVLCPGDTAHLYAVNGSAFTWSVLPGGDGISSLSCVNCQAPQATPKITTRYKVTATNTVCPSLYDTVTVNVLDPPIFTPLSDTVICPGDTITLDLKPVPPVGMGYSYTWSPAGSLSAGNSAAPDAFPSADVTYTVVLTNDYSCKAYDTVKVEVLSGIKIHNNDSTICMGQSMQMKAQGDSYYTYNWQTDAPNPQIVTAGQLNPLVTQADSGTFSYVLTASYPGCPDTTDSVSITTQPYPVITYNPLVKICKGDSLQLSLSVSPDFPYTFKWWPAKRISDPNILNPYYYADTLGKLNYRLIATTSAGCSDTADMQIEITSPTAFLKMLSNDTVICPPDTVRLEVGGTGLKSVRWAPGLSLTDTGSFVTYAFPGATTTFYALGIDSNNCADSLGVTILAKPAGVLRLPRTVRVYPGETYLVDPEGNCSYFKWNTYEYMSGPAANPLIEPKSNITYIAVATTEFGCEATDTMNVIVEDNSVMDVPNAFTPGWGTLHPKIKAEYRGTVELKKFLIYNRWGNKVFETANINEGWDGTLNGAPQPMGVYVYYIVADLDNGTTVKQEGNITLVR